MGTLLVGIASIVAAVKSYGVSELVAGSVSDLTDDHSDYITVAVLWF